MSLFEYQAALQGSDKPKFRDCVLGHKVLNCGWEWGQESLPSSLPLGVTTSVSSGLAHKGLSLPAICKTGAGEGEGEGEEGVE